MDGDWLASNGGNFGRDTITDFGGYDSLLIMDCPLEDGFVYNERELAGNTIITILAPDGKQVHELTLLGVTGFGEVYPADSWWG